MGEALLELALIVVLPQSIPDLPVALILLTDLLRVHKGTAECEQSYLLFNLWKMREFSLAISF